MPGVAVQPASWARIASLRYFDAAGSFTAHLGGAVGTGMPAPLVAIRSAAGGGLILAYRSPTETLALCSDVATLDALERAAAERVDGCVVDLTGGLSVWTLTGERAPALMHRLGATTAVPNLGEARVSRLADLTVMSLCVRPGEIVLLVERVYGPHLLGWIDATLADF